MRTNDFNRVLMFVALAVLTATSNADTLTGQVVGIADGDTLALLDANNAQRKIRLSGIDSPESAQGSVLRSSISGQHS